MRPYEREEFELRLTKELGLTPTDLGTKTTRAWKTPKGRHVLVPVFEKPHRRYYDYHFADIARSVAQLDDQASKVVPFPGTSKKDPKA